MSLLAALEKRSIPVPECGCWIWIGSTTMLGYGRMLANGRVQYAHRLSLAESGVDIDGLVVAHKCDTPACINPEHLFACTQAENLADCVAKNRHARGESHGAHRLTQQDVNAIRGSFERPNVLARRFGVTPDYITMIRKGERWK